MRRWILLSLLGLQALGGAWAYTPTATQVAGDVYAIVGPTDGRTAENHALNNNLGFVVTPEGVVLIDSGASAEGARLVEAAVRTVTDQPVRWVINTGSQDHRWLGNDYFRRQGARIIALGRTVETQRRFADQHMARLEPILKDDFAGTQPATADPAADTDRLELNPGGVPLVLLYPGDAHFPGDAVLWLPEQKVLFSGDLIYVDRMLDVHPWSDVRSWREAFRRVEALQPEVIVPGHGSVCDLAKARRESGDYLDWLVEQVGAAVADWEELDHVVDRLGDEPRFAHLEHFDDWHRTNINRTYLQLEGQ
ncbi:MAG: MBL fold metallo-hydrolase [Pseudomonadota bacterium]|nr:MBL fold metallo-hydrolase [Pseudomonadota bacterium]